MNSQITLFTARPEDLATRVKSGDGEAALSMGLLYLTGLGVNQDLDQADSYFSKARQLGIKDADVFMGYIHECNDRMIKAIDAYVGKEAYKKEGSYSSRFGQLFENVRTERERLNMLLSQFGLPKCPLLTSFNNLLEDLDSGRRSLSDICSIISLSDTNAQWFYETAWLFYEEGDTELANMWLKKCPPDPEDQLMKLIRAKSDELKVIDFTPVELKSDSLLDEKLSVRILPESLFSSGDAIKMALADWSRECSVIRQSYLKDWKNIIRRYASSLRRAIISAMKKMKPLFKRVGVYLSMLKHKLKTETPIKRVRTVNPYWEWISTRETETGGLEYLYVAKSDNKSDDAPFMFLLGKTQEECIETLERMVQTIKSSKHGDNYPFKDVMGDTLTGTVVVGLMGRNKKLVITDTGHRYTGAGHIYSSSLTTALSYFKIKIIEAKKQAKRETN